jgi:cyclomaltodextrinase / maltogenic alpha-amylase / neopullulanase
MNEFIFGSLATLEQRVAYSMRRQSGVWHDNWLEPRAPGAGQSPLLKLRIALPVAVERVVCACSEPEHLTLELEPGAVRWDLFNWSYYQIWQIKLPARPAGTIVRYQLFAYPAGGGEPIIADEGATFSYQVGHASPPAWSREAVIYQVFPDRFHPGHGRDWLPVNSLSDLHGGTLPGIYEQLDYIADLGFNCIWLNPFFPDDTHHGYHATDYFSVNPRLGNQADLHRLVDGAHERGMRLLLDFVANHWSNRHPTFLEAQRNPESDYVNWYRWLHYPDDYKSFFGVRELPQVNVDYPPARAHLLDAARYWLTEFGFDGYRLDYALGPSHDFWTDFRAAVKEANPDAWIFGEVVETPLIQLSYEGRLDGCLDFLLLQALRETFALGTMSVAAFDNFLNLHEHFFPEHFSRPSFLDNHDMNRFLWLAGNDKRKLKLAALCHFTLAGPPVVYYGTEVGLSQQRDIAWPDGRHVMEESRAPMLWGDAQDGELRDYYRRLIHLRRRHPVLWRGRRRTVHLDEGAGTYAYLREDENESLLVLLNLSSSGRTVTAMNQRVTLEPWAGEVRPLPDGSA